MTIKWKIILGFSLMILLITAMAVFGYLRLSTASNSFTHYRSESSTTVDAKSIDALVREIKFLVSRFTMTLNSNGLSEINNHLNRVDAYVKDLLRHETNTKERQDIETQNANIKKIGELARVLEQNLLASNKLLTSTLNPTAAKINDQLTAVNENGIRIGNSNVIEMVDEAYSTFMDTRVTVRAYLSTYHVKDGQTANTMLTSFAALLEKMKGQTSDATTRRSIQDLQDTFGVYHSTFKDCEKLVTPAMAASDQITAYSASLDEFFTAYTNTTEEALNRFGQETLDSNQEAERLMSIAAFAGILTGLAFAVWIVLSVVRVLTRVSSFADSVARGNFDAQLNVNERGEIGIMTSSIKAIPITLKEMAAEYQRLERSVEEGHIDAQADESHFSGGFAALVQGSNNIIRRLRSIFDVIPSPVVVLSSDLKANFLNKTAQDIAGTNYLGKSCKELFNRDDDGTERCALTKAVRTNTPQRAETVAHPQGRRMDIQYNAIPMTDAQGKLSSVLQLIIDLTQIKDTERRIVEVAQEALERADRVAAASEELSAQVEQVSRGAEMQRARVESTATAMNEMNATVLEVAKNAGSASEQSEETKSKANSGANLVDKVVHSINDVNNVALSLQTNMEELGKQAESIGGVMNVISDIADQTNLLALNAAIEAARAGEAGRGFAVVADEVRKLAEKTMSATTEVGANIQAIQQSTRTNIAEVTHAVSNISSATELANASGQALHEIVDLASSNSSVVTSIATAAEEQSATSDEINSALEEVSRIVAETADGMTQASAAVQDLSQVAQQLREIMGRLRS